VACLSFSSQSALNDACLQFKLLCQTRASFRLASRSPADLHIMRYFHVGLCSGGGSKPRHASALAQALNTLMQALLA
jgi:hypothetical protein